MMTRNKKVGATRLSVERVWGSIPPHPGDRVVNNVPRLLKSEMEFAVISVVRNRSARLVALLAAATVGLMVWQDAGIGEIPDRHEAGWVLVSVVAVVWFSRVLAPGGALEAARTVGARWWIPLVGRTLGVVTLLVPIAIVVSYSVGSGDRGVLLFLVAGVVLAASLGTLSMALTPFIGSSAAASFGFIMSIAGGLPPESFELAFSGGPRWLLTFAWRSLPLQWRAEQWVNGEGRFLLVSVLWLGLGIAGGAAAVGWRALVGKWK